MNIEEIVNKLNTGDPFEIFPTLDTGLELAREIDFEEIIYILDEISLEFPHPISNIIMKIDWDLLAEYKCNDYIIYNMDTVREYVKSTQQLKESLYAS